MCSIIGYKGEFDFELVKKICDNSRIRGLHSFGYSYTKNNEILTFKFNSYLKFIDSLKSNSPNIFIAHFRYSTSGDYKNHLNNQPITKQNKSLVFNGVIDMRCKKEIESCYKIKLQTDNDGELALIAKLESDIKFTELIKGKSFAGLFLDQNDNIDVFRNKKRPCWIGYVNQNKIVASTKDILNRTGLVDCKIINSDKIYTL